MDISKLSRGAKLVLGGSIAFLIASIFNWQEVEFADLASAGVSMWHGWGVVAGLVAIALVLWEGARLANVKLELGVSPTIVSGLLAILLLLFTFLKFLVDNEFRTFWAWLGLAFAIVVVVGALENMRNVGESFADVTKGVATAAAGAAGAARGATKSSPSSTPEPPAPPAPDQPASQPTPPAPAPPTDAGDRPA